jgi:hypothetical protein
VAISAEVRRAALWPPMDLPDPPVGHPYTVLRRPAFTVGSFSDTSFAQVTPVSVAAGDVEEMVAEARSLLVGMGKERGAWFVAEACRPKGLADRLGALGMVPYAEPPFEPRFAAMALLSEPLPASPDVDAHTASTLDEFRAANRVSNDVFGLNDEDRRALEAAEKLLWEFESDHEAPYRTFVAKIDDEVVGTAGLIYGHHAAVLVGGSTRTDMRGRGVYRALVRARWDAAVTRDTPVLTVSAGQHSRPILERLGFEIVGWCDCLLDRLP